MISLSIVNWNLHPVSFYLGKTHLTIHALKGEMRCTCPRYKLGGSERFVLSHHETAAEISARVFFPGVALPSSVRHVTFAHADEHALAELRRWPLVTGVRLESPIAYDFLLRLLRMRAWRTVEVSMRAWQQGDCAKMGRDIAEHFNGQLLSLDADWVRCPLDPESGEGRKTLVCDSLWMDKIARPGGGWTDLVLTCDWDRPDRTSAEQPTWLRVRASRGLAKNSPLLDGCVLDPDIFGLTARTRLRLTDNWLWRWHDSFAQHTPLHRDVLGLVADYSLAREHAERVRKWKQKDSTSL